MVRIGTGEIFQLHQAKLFERDGFALRFRHAFHFQAESDIAQRRAPRKQLSEILKHDAAIHAVTAHRLAGDADLARIRHDESGDDIEQR